MAKIAYQRLLSVTSFSSKEFPPRNLFYPGYEVDLFYCDHHPLPLPERHKFPLRKYRMVRDLLGRSPAFHLREAPFATQHDLLRVHTESYIQKFLNGTLEPAATRRIGFPWSAGLVERTLASTGGTLAATRAALETGIAGTMAGGTHHAFRSEGAGFCVFNDLAVATEWARQCHNVRRIAIIDLDVHQGDGTASIFENDQDVFTLSLHGARNFPFHKQRSRLDIELPDGTQSEEYCAALDRGLTAVWAFDPHLVLYQSGVDTLSTDRLGRLSLTLHDLALRDRLVFEEAKKRGVPIAVTMGGGYSDPIECTAEAHAQTFRTAASVFERETMDS